MNETTYIEASRVLAQKVLSEGGRTPQQRITYAFRRALCRKPTPQEIKILTQGLQRRLVKYKANPEVATQLVSIGESLRDPKMDVSELAAYTLTMSIILNLDETVTKE